MSASDISTAGGPNRTIISVDAMGGDLGPAAVVAGLDICLAKNPDIGIILHGPDNVLSGLVEKSRNLPGRCDIRHAEGVVSMEDKPSHVMRNGKGTSMWSTIDAVKNGEAAVAVSCGNTGALMAVSMIRLRKMPGVNRPAIACLWPSNAATGFNILLDVGADIRADAQDLLQYALMGASYARNGLGLDRPKVGLLNVGTEEHKGRPELKEAHELIGACAKDGAFEFVGFVEGGDIPSGAADVIVTDGFTGNIALKTGEGTASLIRDFLRQALKATPLSRIAAMLAMGSLKRLTKRIDPRRVNGGVFLGLTKTVIKSHGAADATGVAAAVNLAVRLAESGFSERLAARVATTATPRDDVQGDGTETNPGGAI